jgi:acetyl esterase/lipase
MVTKISPGRERKSITFIDNILYSTVYSPLKDCTIELKMSIMAQYGNSEMRAATGLPLMGAQEQDDVQKKPAIVWIPGGGFRGVDKNLMVPEMQFLAEAGYIVASIYYRSSAEAIFPAQIIDVKSAIRFLRSNAEKYCIDPKRIGVTGRSAGGHLTALASMNLPGYDQGDNLELSSDVQCGVDYFGPVDLFAAFKSVRDGIKPGSRWKTVEESHEGAFIGGTDVTKPELTLEASPVLRVNERSAPMLILHGEADPLISFNQSIVLHDKMIAAGKECDLYLLEGAGHGTDEFWQNSTKKLVTAFFDAHLKSN